ncbi:hypothetical protein CsatA_003484 [Cannabis sativa]
MCDLVSSICGAVVAELIKDIPIYRCVRHVNRLCHCATHKRNVKRFNEQLEILHKFRDELSKDVESKKQKQEQIHNEVNDWLHETQYNIFEKREEAERASQNFCYFTFHPKATIDEDTFRQIKKKINGLIERYVNFNGRISYPSPYLDKDYMAFEGRRRILEDVMNALKDPTVQMIGLCGMGGIGKTTLAKAIARQAKEVNLFDKVIMGSAVSQTLDVATIQCEIANDLGVEFGNHETNLTKAKKLREELSKREKVLIILDDIWQHIKLFDIGIHFSDDQTGCKILFTSRRQGLYNPAVEFALHSLQEDESTKLFRKVVGKILDENLDCSRELVKECGGVPIVINTVAAALKDAPSFKWNTFLNELRNSAPKSIEGMESKVFRSIKLSYDFLESKEAKSLLLLCSIFPEDRLISDVELLMYSVGLPSFNNVKTLGDARDKLYTLIDTLRKHCLLLPSDESESGVKLHDVIRDVLKSVAKEEGLFSVSKYEELPEEKHANLAVVSLLPDFETQLPDILVCPKLVSFIDVSVSFCRKRLSDCFFVETKKLKVLKLRGVHLHSPPPPSSFSCLLESLETLCLNYCDLEDTTFLGSFKKLKCLDLSESRFKTLSKQVGQLTHLQLLNLDYCKDLEVIEPDVISSLKNLEELYMSDVEKAWEVEKVSSERSNVSLAELKNLDRLNTLYLKIKNDTYLSKDFISTNMKRYKIIVGEFNTLRFTYSRVLMLELHNANLINECGFDKLMKECQALMLRGCEGVPIDTYVSNTDGFPELEVFELRDASNVRYLMEYNHPVFQNLKKLKLEALPKLQKIYAGELVAGSFSTLKKVEISRCDRLKSLFPVSTIAGQLEEMEVKHCGMIENIVFHRSENGTHQKIVFAKLQKLVLLGVGKLIQFCKVEREQNLVTSLSLDSSPSTNKFSFFMEVVSFPMLEQLKLLYLYHVKMIWPDKFQEVSYMQNLKDLTVDGCHKLKYLFSSAVARSFIQLRNLTVGDCENMEEIVVIKEGGEEEGSSNDTISFPKLEWIRLKNLKNLKRFSGGKHLAVKFKGLMKTISCKLSKKMKRSCRNEFEEAKLEPLFNQKVSFPMLECLDLDFLPSVEMIWADELEEVSYMQNLKDLSVDGCHKLKYVFPCVMERRLVQLRNLKIRGCWNMEGILVIKEGASVMEELHLINHHHPMALETLQIGGCQKLKMMKSWRSRELVEAEDHTFTENKVVVPNLEEVSLKCMFLPSSMSFLNLREICISNHDGMINLMNSSTARSLVQLQKMTISKCKQMRQVIVDEEEAGENVMVFSKLKALMLHGLPNLKSFNCGNSEIQFPNLEKVIVSECPHMENFSSGNVITSKLAKIFTKLQYEYFYNVIDAKGIEEVWKSDLKTTLRMIWEEANKTNETEETNEKKETKETNETKVTKETKETKETRFQYEQPMKSMPRRRYEKRKRGIQLYRFNQKGKYRGKGKSHIVNIPSKFGVEEPSRDVVVELQLENIAPTSVERTSLNLVDYFSGDTTSSFIKDNSKSNQEFGSKSVPNAAVEGDQGGPSSSKGPTSVERTSMNLVDYFSGDTTPSFIKDNSKGNQDFGFKSVPNAAVEGDQGGPSSSKAPTSVERTSLNLVDYFFGDTTPSFIKDNSKGNQEFGSKSVPNAAVEGDQGGPSSSKAPTSVERTSLNSVDYFSGDTTPSFIKDNDKGNQEFGFKSVPNAVVEGDQSGPSSSKAHEHVTRFEYQDLKKDVSLVLSQQQIIMSAFADLNRKMDTLIKSSRSAYSHHSSQTEDVLRYSKNDDDLVGDGEREDDEEIDFENDDEPGDDNVKGDDDVDDNANDNTGGGGPDDDDDCGGGDDRGQSVSVVEKVKIDEVHIAIDGGAKPNEDVVDASTAQECIKIADKLVDTSGIFGDLKEDLFSNDDNDLIDAGASMACGVHAVENRMESSSTDVVAGQYSISSGFQGLVQNDVRDIIIFEETPILIPRKRDRKKGVVLKSPFIELGFSDAKLDSMSNSPDDSNYKMVKYVHGLCPLDDKIGEPIEPTLEAAFDVWLGQDLRLKKSMKTTNVYLKGKDKISPPFRFGVEEVDNKISLLSFPAQHRGLQRVEMLEIELRKTREHRDAMAKKWNDSESELARVKKEAEEQQRSLKTKLESAQKKMKELEDANKAIQTEADRKLEEAKVDTKNRVKRSIYKVWLANPEMDFSFLGKGAKEMLAYCEKTKKEEAGDADEVEEDQEEPTKSPTM